MGGDMREIVDVEQVGRLFAALALVLPPLCLLCGWWYGGRRQMHRRGALVGLLLGLLGPLNYGLWHIYNRITDSVGLDTVRNLAINLVLFVVLGAVIGVGVGLAARHFGAAPTGHQPTDETE